MITYLYRTVCNDDDGDPLDHGIVQAHYADQAAAYVHKHMMRLGISINDSAFYLYQAKGKANPGVIKTHPRMLCVRGKIQKET